MPYDSTKNQVPPDKEPRIINCVVLKDRLPGMVAPPFQTPLGQRIFQDVSQAAWLQWLAHSKMLINEHNLKLSEPEAREYLRQACEAWLFEGQQTPPPGWVPSSAGFIPVLKKPVLKKNADRE